MIHTNALKLLLHMYCTNVCQLTSSRPFHQTLPNLGLILGLRTSYVSIDALNPILVFSKIGSVACARSLKLMEIQ